MKKLLSKNRFGVETWMHHDGETIAIETKQDVSRVLDLNKKIRNEFQGYKDKGEHHFHLYDRIPNVVITKCLNEPGIACYDPDPSYPAATPLYSNESQSLRQTEGVRQLNANPP